MTDLKKKTIRLKDFENIGISDKYRRSDDFKWLKGDFHVHSILSDGSSSPDQLLNEGLSKQLDFFFITEHGILAPSFPEKKGISVFPGLEVTTSKGHFNILGIKFLPDKIHGSGPAPDWGIMESVMRNARNSGSLISVNHPMLHPWEWLYNELPLSMIDSVEVITDPYAADDGAPEANERAVKFLDLLWNHGYRVTGIGGK